MDPKPSSWCTYGTRLRGIYENNVETLNGISLLLFFHGVCAEFLFSLDSRSRYCHNPDGAADG